MVAAGVFTWSLFHAESERPRLRARRGPVRVPHRTRHRASRRTRSTVAERLLAALVARGRRAPAEGRGRDRRRTQLPHRRTLARDRVDRRHHRDARYSSRHRELEAVLAYELGRVVELEVSLDTVVYACTARTFELWAAAFADLDETSLLLAPLGLLALPFVAASVRSGRGVLRSRARLADGLAIRYCREPGGARHGAAGGSSTIRDEVRRGDPANAHLWLGVPAHPRLAAGCSGTHRILPRRVRRLERRLGPRPAPGEHAVAGPDDVGDCRMATTTTSEIGPETTPPSPAWTSRPPSSGRSSAPRPCEHQGRVADAVLDMLRSLADDHRRLRGRPAHALPPDRHARRARRCRRRDGRRVALPRHRQGRQRPEPPDDRRGDPQAVRARTRCYEVIRAHQDFQGRHYYHHFGGDPNAREQYRGEPWFDLAAQFADEWDQIAFDPDYDTLPLEHFEPRVREVFAHARL